MRCLAILLAAGESRRFGKDKIWLNLQDQPVWKWSYGTFLNHPLVHAVGIVGPQQRHNEFRALAPGAEFIIEGGSTRKESAYKGLQAANEEFDLVLFHDAARPFISKELIARVIEATKARGAACPGIAITDTIKQKQKDSYHTIDRDQLVAVQTPQGAYRKHWLLAHQNVLLSATDDTMLLEAAGINPEIVPGEKENIKLTTQEDYELALIKMSAPDIRTGLGYDIHSFSKDPSRPLYLAGVLFEGNIGLEGHSDADVVLHAVVDALLGAAGLGDIGQHYPNTEPEWKDVSSKIFLKETIKRLQTQGWQILNIDISVLAEHPKIICRKKEMIEQIAKEIGLECSKINMKATTNEKLGAIGRGEGIAAFAIATIRRWV